MNILWMPVLPPTLNLNMEVKESLMHKLECNGIKLMDFKTVFTNSCGNLILNVHSSGC